MGKMILVAIASTLATMAIVSRVPPLRAAILGS